MPAIDALFSQMALMVYALNVYKSMATASVAKSVPSGDCENTFDRGVNGPAKPANGCHCDSQDKVCHNCLKNV